MSTPTDVTTLTTGSLTGDGVLDKLLKTTKVHLQEHYDLGRIQGKEFSEAFVNLYQINLQHSIAYLFQQNVQSYEISKIIADTELSCKNGMVAESNALLIQQNTANALYETENTKLRQAQIKAETENAIGVGLLTSLQRDKVRKEIIVTNEQAALIKLQGDKLRKEIKLADIEYKIAEYNLNNKLPAEVALLKAQEAKLLKDISLADKQLALADKELALKDKEIESMQAQVDLYRQKIVTEKAQVDPSVIVEGSVLDHNNKLLAAQTRAYKDDQVIKASKLLLDSYVTSVSNGDANANTLNLQDDATLGKMMVRLGETVDVPLTPVPLPPVVTP